MRLKASGRCILLCLRPMYQDKSENVSVEASAKMYEAYKAYFGMPVGDQDKPKAPHFTAEKLWKYRGEQRAMKFDIPRIWRKPTNHLNNFYFCMVDPSKRRTGKNAPAVTCCPELSVPTPERKQQSLEVCSKSESEEDVIDPDDNFRGGAEERNPYDPNQRDLNYLIRDLGLTKSNAQLLTSIFKQYNLLNESVQVANQRKRHQAFPASSSVKMGFKRSYQGQYNENMIGSTFGS